MTSGETRTRSEKDIGIVLGPLFPSKYGGVPVDLRASNQHPVAALDPCVRPEVAVQIPGNTNVNRASVAATDQKRLQSKRLDQAGGAGNVTSGARTAYATRSAGAG